MGSAVVCSRSEIGELLGPKAPSFGSEVTLIFDGS